MRKREQELARISRRESAHARWEEERDKEAAQRSVTERQRRRSLVDTRHKDDVKRVGTMTSSLQQQRQGRTSLMTRATSACSVLQQGGGGLTPMRARHPHQTLHQHHMNCNGTAASGCSCSRDHSKTGTSAQVQRRRAGGHNRASLWRWKGGACSVGWRSNLYSPFETGAGREAPDSKG